MSGTDPLAAMSARVAAAQAAMLDAAIDLGVSAGVLQAQIATGDILSAKILAPQNGQDLIEILGQRVAAQLPPGVHPGETLLLQVTGFGAQQIFVRNLGTPDPRNPLPVNDAVLPAPENPTQTATLTTRPPAPPASEPGTPPPPVAPPPSVFVAASVRQASPIESAAAQEPGALEVLQSVEARIAAAQAAPGAPAAPLAAPAVRVPPLVPPRAPAAPAVPAPAPPSHGAVSAAIGRAVQTVSEFLRAARLPDTPFTRMAATIAAQAPERVPSVLQRLEAALPPESSDARVSTLRTLIGFTARLSPANAETLPAQIAAYVSNVLEGVEAKLAQLLQAHAQAAAPPQPQQAAAPREEQAPLPAAAAPDSRAPAAPAPLPPLLAQARAAERSAAVEHDLKSVVLSLLRDPPAARTPALTQALTETLVTLTGAQVNALSNAAQNPGTFTLCLPAFYHEHGKPAQVRISRDPRSKAARLDADNFHVAFVLDTAHLGTVAIDLQTAGRTVNLEVKTENASAAARFADTLGSLRTRLEDLRYRVASAAASALPARVPNASAQGEPAHADRAEKKRGVDLRA